MTPRDYRTVSGEELKTEVKKCFERHPSGLGVKSITKTLVTRLELDRNNLGPKIDGHRNTFHLLVAKAVQVLAEKGVILKKSMGEWVLNENYIEESDSFGMEEIDINELTATGRVEKAVMDIFRTLGQILIAREELVELIQQEIPNTPIGTITQALAALSVHNEGYLHIPMQGQLRLTEKGDQAIKTGRYNFQKRSQVRSGAMRQAYPTDEVKAAILYALASATSRSLEKRQIARRCAELFAFQSIEQAVGAHNHDQKPFEKRCYEVFKGLKDDELIRSRCGSSGNEITPSGWASLNRLGFELARLGVEAPSRKPLALTNPYSPPEIMSTPPTKPKLPEPEPPEQSQIVKPPKELPTKSEVYLSIKEVAERLRVSTNFVRNRIDVGDLTLVDVRDGWKTHKLVPESHVEAYLAKITVEAEYSELKAKDKIESPVILPLPQVPDEFEAMRAIWSLLELFDYQTQDRILDYQQTRRRQARYKPVESVQAVENRKIKNK